ncbi:MAG: hypothetical protein ACR2RB_19230 [Gammaproteobacteria bacterium]
MPTKKTVSSKKKTTSTKKTASRKKIASTKTAAAKKTKAAVVDASPKAKLDRRKLDALKRGIHRIGEEETTPFSVHVLGIGKAGADVISQILRDKASAPVGDDDKVFTALAVDIGDQDVAQVRRLADSLPGGSAQVETVALEVPTRNDLFSSLRRYREFLKLEYPRYYWNPNYEPWLPSSSTLPQAGERFPRSVAKAIYGRSYYDGSRDMRAALRRFAESVDSAPGQSVVAIVFGMGGGTGSGMVVDLARHLSNVCFGRRALVVGIAIAPCDGDDAAHTGAQLFPVLNELDCMGDQAKNEGVIAVWGDLYRNPFTSGVIVVPQQPMWEASKNLSATHERVDREISSFLTRNDGVDLWETLRMLNWVGAPPTQHAAARTPYGDKWAHVLGFADYKDGVSADKLTSSLGVRASYRPEFIEVRAAEKNAAADRVAKTLGDTYAPTADPEVALAPGGSTDGVQFILPCVSKTDFEMFFTSRKLYDERDWEQKLSDHSWLLDLGVLLCEPAIRFNGMAGECLWGCACWVVVPYEQIRGPAETAAAVAAA